jgi:3-methylcrotonyl-CoA carboxylase alpha subunit
VKEHLRIGGEVHELELIERGNAVAVSIDGETHEITEVKRDGAEIGFTLGGKRHTYLATTGRRSLTLWREGEVFRGERVEGASAADDASAGGGSLVSQMPGMVLKLLHEPGAEVKAGTPLLILEAMKMEHEISAPSNGKLVAYPFKEGDRVMPGDLLVEFEAAG